MRRQATPLSFLPDLHMPLRDALRGVAVIADATEEVLEPATRLLPAPMAERFREALGALEAASKRLMVAPITAQDIQTAADLVTGHQTEAGAAATTAKVLSYAWEHIRTAELGHHELISETLLAAHLGQTRGTDGRPSENAAAFFAHLRSSRAMGPVPGFVRPAAEDDFSETDRALLTITVWLLSAREESLEAEERLLDLSSALVTALNADLQVAADDTGTLADALETAAAHL